MKTAIERYDMKAEAKLLLIFERRFTIASKLYRLSIRNPGDYLKKKAEGKQSRKRMWEQIRLSHLDRLAKSFDLIFLSLEIERFD